MTTVSTTEISRKPSLISSPRGITIIEDGRKHEPKSVLLPYEFFLRIREKIEDEIYLEENREALSKPFNESEEVVGELA